MRFSLVAPVLFTVLLGQASAADVQLCGGTNYGECSSTIQTNDAQCYNVGDLYNDRVKAVKISGGNCVFWANVNCQGDHTNQIFGDTPDAASFCSSGWQNRISSFKCCGNNVWCAGNTPKCT